MRHSVSPAVAADIGSNAADVVLNELAHNVVTQLEHWFDATGQFPLQLREMDKASYLRMKKIEYQRQPAAS